MRVRRLAVTLAACCLQVRPAAADESINIFVAIDAAYYLGLVLCGMVRAYGEPSSAARRGRPFKFFVLHGPRLPATTVCAASEAALRCRAARPLNPKFGTDRDLARVETRRCRAGRARPTGADAHNSSTPTIPAGPASARPRRRDSRGPSTPSRSRAPEYRSWRLRRATLAHSRPSARSCNRLWRPRERESRAQATVPRALDAVHRLSREEAAANAHHCSRRGERAPAPFSLSPANPRSAPFQAREPPQPRAGRGRRVPSPAGCAASAARRSGPTIQCPLNPRAPQVLVLDADAWPERNVLSLYDAEAPAAASVVALARWHAKCRSFTEGWNLADPLVRATLGRDRRAIDQRRFRASVLLVPDLERSRAASPVCAPRRRLDGSRRLAARAGSARSTSRVASSRSSSASCACRIATRCGGAGFNNRR